MPGMTGTQLARNLRGKRPNLNVLIISGYADADGVDPDLPRLAKPFRQSDLATALLGLTQLLTGMSSARACALSGANFAS